MTTTNRPYNKNQDLDRLQAFLAEMRAERTQASYFHIGDVLFRFYKKTNDFDIEKDIRVWEVDGEIVGFVLYLAVDINPEFQLKTDYYNTKVFNEMVAWSVERAKELGHESIECGCIDVDEIKRDALLASGFIAIDEPFVCMETVIGDLPNGILPEGYSILTTRDTSVYTRLTGNEPGEDEYIGMYESSGYNKDLGFRVIHETDGVVAGCMTWFDPLDKSGLFEPVGTNEKHRGKGLATLVMTVALKALKKMGAIKAYVHTDGGNLPAINLYKKLGFSIMNIDNGYEMTID